MDLGMRARLEAVPGHVGFFFRDLTTGETQTYHSEDCFQAASIIKLPIFAAVLLQAREDPGILKQSILVRDGEKVPGCGALQHITGDREYDVLTLCKLMITISDNTATNALIHHFGMESLNRDFRRLGLERTRIYRKLFDAEAAAAGWENLFQPEELARLLEKIYRKECISPSASRQLAEVLQQQQINHKIPGRLPAGLQVAHKTGEDSGITNDLGIVYGKHPCILVFASNNTDVPVFEQVIRDLSYYYAVERKERS